MLTLSRTVRWEVSMTRAAGVVLLAALSFDGRPVPVSADLLSIDVVAHDRDGMPVLDLKPAEFELWINGFQIPIQRVTFVAPTEGDDGRTIVLLLDDMAAHPTALPRIRAAARRFVEQMSPRDRMSIVALDGGAMASTNDRARLLSAIDAYHVKGFPVRVDDAGAHVFGTVAALSRQMAEAPGGRKAVVAIGTDWLFDRPIPPGVVTRDLRPDWVAAMRATAAAHVSLYVIDPAGVGTRLVTGGGSGFARETGGFAFTNTNDVNAAVDRILREIGTYYVLGIENPPVGKKDDLREVDVKVRRSNVTVRARKGIPPAP
jgi:VWFA-related protein